MGWAIELVKWFDRETSCRNITGDREECRRKTLRCVLWILAMKVGGGPTRSAVVFSDGFGISSRVLLSGNTLIYLVIICNLGT